MKTVEHVEPGGEHLLKWAREQLARLTRFRHDTRLPVMHKHWVVGESMVNVRSSEWGDFIRITAGAPPQYIHAGPGPVVVGSVAGPYVGLADHSVGLYSVWVEGGGESFVCNFLSFSTGPTFGVLLNKDSVLISVWNGIGSFLSSTPAEAWSAVASGSITWSDGWHHLLVSYSLPTGFVAYFDDEPVALTPTTVGTGAPFSAGNTADGLTHEFDAEDACVGELYWAPGQILDLSLEENRQRFGISKPGFKGDGSAPTGATPVLYSPFFFGEDTHLNKGTGGDWPPILFGACGTSP